MSAARLVKCCRRCKAAKRKPSWTCRGCGALCCEHLCALKSVSGGDGMVTIASATCGSCKK